MRPGLSVVHLITLLIGLTGALGHSSLREQPSRVRRMGDNSVAVGHVEANVDEAVRKYILKSHI